MTVLVTGATGVVGANLVRTLLKAGQKIRVLVRNNDKSNAVLKDLPVEQAFGEITQPNSLRRALKGCDLVYHTEELNPFGYCSADAYFRTNVEGTRSVFEASLERGVRRIVHTGSALAVGCGTRSKPLRETAPFDLEHLKDPYISSKREAEALALEFSAKGLEIVTLNPGIVLGAWSLQPSIGYRLLRISGSMTRLCPGGGCLFSDAEDVARANLLAMEKGRSGERYIVGSETMRYIVLFNLLSSVLGFAPAVLLVPRFLALFTASLSDSVSSLVRRSFSLLPSASVVKRTYTDFYLSSEKATIELGISWTPFRETLRKTVVWLRANGML